MKNNQSLFRIKRKVTAYKKRPKSRGLHTLLSIRMKISTWRHTCTKKMYANNCLFSFLFADTF